LTRSTGTAEAAWVVTAACIGGEWWWCAVAAGFGAAGWAVAAVVQTAASAASSASPAAGRRVRVNDMTCSFLLAMISGEQAEMGWRVGSPIVAVVTPGRPFWARALCQAPVCFQK
jgi:hypothetical protein